MSEEVKVLDHGYVRLIESWGTGDAKVVEAGIIEAARQSTQGSFRGWGAGTKVCSECNGTRERTYEDLVWDEEPEQVKVGPVSLELVGEYRKVKTTGACRTCKGTGTLNVAGDEKLLHYLWEHKHATPFEMAGMVIEVQAPIFVFREWHRHRTMSYNELSARYTEVPELFYVPSEERLHKGGQGKKNKQGSGESFDSEDYVMSVIRTQSANAFQEYKGMLKIGLSRELARLVLPVNTYSRMRASANLRNWLAFLTLRLDEAAQWEIRQYAEAVGSIVAERFPRTWELFEEGR